MTTWRPLRPAGSERDPTRVADSLDRVSRKLGGPATRAASAVFSGWEEIVGPDIAAHAKPITLRRGVLILGVDDPAWAAQLKFMASELKAKIERVAGAGEVLEIQLRVVG